MHIMVALSIWILKCLNLDKNDIRFRVQDIYENAMNIFDLETLKVRREHLCLEFAKKF